MPTHAIKTELINVQLNNIKSVKNIFIERIDDTHANATAAWVAMGKPETLLPEQVNVLEAASALIKEKIFYTFEKETLLIDIEMQPQATALVTIETI